MILLSRKQNPTDGSAQNEPEDGRACGGEAGALMGAGAKLLPGLGAEPQENAEYLSARASTSVPTIPPADKPLTWLQRRRQKRADIYQAARDHGLRHALSIADELAEELAAGRISGDGLATFIGLVVDVINPLEFAPSLKPKDVRRLRAELGGAIIDRITDKTKAALDRQEDEKP